MFLIFKKIENPYFNCMNCILVFQKKYYLSIIFRYKIFHLFLYRKFL